MEKLEIAQRYLVKKQIKENGLSDAIVEFGAEGLKKIIQRYTRESGVRNLEREIGSVCRKIARRVVAGNSEHQTIEAETVVEILGKEKFRYEVADRKDEIGVATGLAWTPVGGEVLFVEATPVPAKGAFLLTGQLGDVMQESAQAALTYTRARAQELGIPDKYFEEHDIHVHVPAGATPKDGPSAGVTMAAAIISAVTRRPVDSNTAMTGEITLRGKVLPVGGIKEKVLAAHRAGAKRVMMPRENERDWGEVPEEIRSEMKVEFLDYIDEALKLVLLPAQKGPDAADKEPAKVA